MNNNTIKLLVDENDVGMRLDLAISEKISGLTRSNIKKIIQSKGVLINNDVINSPAKKVKLNDAISINIINNNAEIKVRPSNIKLEIIFEDKDLLVVNKPVGMVVHPGAGN